MTELSPSAQAVLDAGIRHIDHRPSIAAALHVVAWQCEFQSDTLKILSIAEELNQP
jgi:hypothetical protein